jgi:RimJ/RimL family protein N-acetyltransferase
LTVDVEVLTPRLLLRPHRDGDFEALHALTAASEARTHLAGFAGQEDSWRRFLSTVGGWTLFGFSSFAVIERDSGLYVGNCGLFRMKRDIEPPFDGEPEAGWIVAPSRWGRGYATEAMQAALTWFEAGWGLQRTVAMISVGNTASERIAAKLGYLPIGLAVHRGDQVMRYARDL